jgi:3alpha(or 20beta)-hydroxysteroid dehydrogenase
VAGSGTVQGKVAIITGAARGQGAAEAALFAAEGAHVVLSDITASGADIAASLPNAVFYEHDVTSEASWRDLVEKTLAKYGTIDVLVNNAGVVSKNGLLDTSLTEYRHIIEVNQTGPWLGMQAVVPVMRRSGGGSIVNISSTAGLAGTYGAIAYTTSKWALRGMTKSVASEFAADNIRANSVHPGRMESPMFESMRDRLIAESGPDNERAIRGIPLGRLGRLDEIAHLVLWLASDRSSYCTGAEFVADGGQTSQMNGQMF